jgi:hypothetical protein
MYFLATLHPPLGKEFEDEGFLTLEEKRKAIDEFYDLKEDIPLCVDHGSGKTHGYVVKEEEKVGKVLDLFNDEHGNVVAKCIHYMDNDHYSKMDFDKDKWGVSMWIDIQYDHNAETKEISNKTKKLTHVAVTISPAFADYNTFVHHWSLEEYGLNGVINKEYFTEGKGQCYASKSFKDKIKIPTYSSIHLYGNNQETETNDNNNEKTEGKDDQHQENNQTQDDKMEEEEVIKTHENENKTTLTTEVKTNEVDSNLLHEKNEEEEEEGIFRSLKDKPDEKIEIENSKIGNDMVIEETNKVPLTTTLPLSSLLQNEEEEEVSSRIQPLSSTFLSSLNIRNNTRLLQGGEEEQRKPIFSSENSSLFTVPSKTSPNLMNNTCRGQELGTHKTKNERFLYHLAATRMFL